jgi:hypothetical protein
MMDGEKRIVTFMGNAGRRTATITWKNIFDLFEVDCTDDGLVIMDTKFFKEESDAQTYAEQFVWREKYGTI